MNLFPSGYEFLFIFTLICFYLFFILFISILLCVFDKIKKHERSPVNFFSCFLVSSKTHNKVEINL